MLPTSNLGIPMLIKIPSLLATKTGLEMVLVRLPREATSNTVVRSRKATNRAAQLATHPVLGVVDLNNRNLRAHREGLEIRRIAQDSNSRGITGDGGIARRMGEVRLRMLHREEIRSKRAGNGEARVRGFRYLGC